MDPTLHKHFNVRKLTSRWIPNLLCTEQKRLAEAKQQSSLLSKALPTKVVRVEAQTKKWLLFFVKILAEVVIPLELLKKVPLPQFEKLKPVKSGLRNIFIYQDNTPANNAARTLGFLRDSWVQLVTHPLCSPDLVPRVFCFSNLLKKWCEVTDLE